MNRIVYKDLILKILLGARVFFYRFIAGFIAFVLPRKIMQEKQNFKTWEKHGYHVTPNHFYEPIPDTRGLSNTLWDKNSDMIGINLNVQKQMDLLLKFSDRFKNEYESIPREKPSVPYQYYLSNGQYEFVDGAILYCMVRYFKPKRIFEIGSGNSTYLSAQAIQKNGLDRGDNCSLVAYEPYPNAILIKGFPGLSKLVKMKIEDIPLSEFEQLKENDILFIDSSHVLKIGGDVKYELLEILPRLNKGVIIHFHDIFLPAEYPRDWILKRFQFWTEQYLLQAFLAFNDSFEVLWAGHYMHLTYPEKLNETFSYYDKNKLLPGSFWIRKVK